jgi:hypothetical protein
LVIERFFGSVFDPAGISGICLIDGRLYMKRWWYVVGFLLALLMIPVSCRQLFTTSLAKPLARTSITISPNATTSELLELANSSAGATPEGAKAILAALASRPEDVAALSAADKTTVLDMAITATINMDSVTKAANSAQSNTDPNKTTADILKSFDTSVDTTAVMVIMSDPKATADIPAEKLVYSGAVLIADAAKTTEPSVIMDAVSSGDTTTLNATDKAKVDAVIAVEKDLTTNRSTELSTLTIGSYNIGDLIKGTL